MREGASLGLLSFKVQNIRSKLLLYFFMLILFPIVTLGVLGNVIYNRSMENQTNAHTEQMIEQVTKNVEFYIHDMENIIHYLSQEPRVLEYFKLENNEGTVESVELAMKRILKSYTDVHPEIAGILIVTQKDRSISNEIYRIARDPLTDEIWYRRAAASPKTIQLVSKPIGRNISAIGTYSADEVVSIVKAVSDPLTGKCLGVILIDLKLNMIKQVIEGITLGKTGFLYIMDSNGEVVYAPINPVVYRVKYEWLSDPTNNVVRTIQGNDYQIIFKDSNYTNWKFVGVFSLNETLKEVTNIRYYSILIGVFTLVLAVVAAFFFTSSIAKPLSKLRSLMKRAEEGDLSVRFNSRYSDEIGQLGNSFNNMIQEISNLIDLVYEEQKRKREAELKTLQAQIKPHFLYNTLDTIHWMAQEQGSEEIVNVVGALANLFRIGLSKGKEIISVREELEHVKSYLIIQKARYEDKLNYEICYDEQLLEYYVPKLILQPLVENAIYHGINARRGGGMVCISAWKKENQLCFSVVDNGLGISPEKFRELEGLLGSGQKPPNTGFGVFSINERIRLSFGPDYGLSFNSVYGEGTTVTVRLPLFSTL